jgi:hypothetical protein
MLMGPRHSALRAPAGDDVRSLGRDDRVQRPFRRDETVLRTAYAQGTTVPQGGSAVTADCGSGDATLNGSGNAILFRNACRTLTVNGSGNTVQIELKSAGTITLNGTGNLVSYAPRWRHSGSYDRRSRPEQRRGAFGCLIRRNNDDRRRRAR